MQNDRLRDQKTKSISETLKNIKCLKVTIYNPMEYLYNKNFRTLKTEIERMLEDRKISHAHE